VFDVKNEIHDAEHELMHMSEQLEKHPRLHATSHHAEQLLAHDEQV
jgi:hypothetical protein